MPADNISPLAGKRGQKTVAGKKWLKSCDDAASCMLLIHNKQPFDSPQVISYWWSFGTKPLSLTVSNQIDRDIDIDIQWRLSVCHAMVDMTLNDL